MPKLKTSSHYLRTLLKVADDIGLDTDRLTSELNLPPPTPANDNIWLDNAVITYLVKALWRESSDETMGISPVPTRMGTWALACNYMIAAETLGDLYRRGEHIFSYLPPDNMGIQVAVEHKHVRVQVNAYHGERDPDHFLIEFLSIVWHRFACWASNEFIPLQRVDFSYPAPEHHLFYEELFQCPVFFDQQYCSFTFNKKMLQLPIYRTEGELLDWLRESPADLLYIPGRDHSITHHIKVLLAKYLRDHCVFPAFETVCAKLIMSKQLVRRRLDEEGTSYQKIKDQVRQALIQELLLNPDLPLSEVTQRAGFAEAASLSRAFKKWTGLTPVQYREKSL